MARKCCNCGTLINKTDWRARFCGTRCKREFNNRQATRGATAYPFIMAMRYDRSEAAKHKAWGTLCQLAAQWRDEDKAEREGRRSWHRLPVVLDQLP
jgi:hypothetical protein